MLFDFNQVWGDQFINYTLIRYMPGYDNAEGQYVPGTSTQQTIQGMPPQPLNEKELMQFTDGQKTQDIQKIYTSFPVRVRTGEVNADRFQFEGQEYEVIKVETRDILGNYYKATVRKIQGDV